MRIGPFGPWEILVILVVFVLLFGAKRLPGMGKGIAQSVREFRRGVRDDGRDTTPDDGAPPSTPGTEPHRADTDPPKRP